MTTALQLRAMARADEVRRAESAKRAHLDLRDSERRLYSLPNAFRALLDQKVTQGSFEAEVSEALSPRHEKHTGNSLLIPYWALAQRDLTTANSGGYLVATETPIEPGLVDLLRGRSAVASLPVTRMTGCVGNFSIPVETAAPTAYVLAGEDTQITESQPTVGSVAMTPKNVAAITEVSKQFTTMTGASGAAYLRRSLLGAVAAKFDALAINGSGNSGEPLGLVSQITGTVSGTSLDEADVREFQTDVGESLGPDCGWCTTYTVASLLNGRQRFTGSSNTLWEGNLYAGSMGGWPGFTSPSVPASHLVFGAWASLVVAEWGEALEVALNPYASFNTGGTAVRCIATFDTGLVRPAAFSKATAVT